VTDGRQARLQPRLDRLMADVETLSTFRDPNQPGWTRRACSPEYLAARLWLRERMEHAGLSTSIDAAGNLIGSRPGRRDLDPIIIGSHIDTVRGAGRFDGVVGIVAALEIARCLQETGTVLEHPLEVIDFFAQEPLDSGVDAVGARSLSYWWVKEQLYGPGVGGMTLAKSIERAGGRTRNPHEMTREQGSVTAYLELHVEQGPILASEGLSVGIVTSLPYATRMRAELKRRAFLNIWPTFGAPDTIDRAIAELAESLQRIEKAGTSTSTVARMIVNPNGADSRSNGVEMWFELQDEDGFHYERDQKFRRRFESVARQNGLNGSIESVGFDMHVPVSDEVQAIFEETLLDLNLPVLRLPSPATHAGNSLYAHGPVGMLFIPSYDGVTHCPEERTDPADIHIGTTVLGESLLRIDERVASGERLQRASEWIMLDRERNYLGTLVFVGADQPWFFCKFEPLPAFEDVRHRFEESIRLIEAPSPKEPRPVEGQANSPWDRIAAVYAPIWELGLRVESTANDEFYTQPMLQIRGRRARLRGLPDNWREDHPR
jgi:beta-ureidopropionase / N-carbamoyl-L-amino-acid hydrolase